MSLHLNLLASSKARPFHSLRGFANFGHFPGLLTCAYLTHHDRSFPNGKHAHEKEESKLFAFVPSAVGPFTGRTRVSFRLVKIGSRLAHRNEATRPVSKIGHRMLCP